jgi:hypothetical protein
MQSCAELFGIARGLMFDPPIFTDETAIHPSLLSVVRTWKKPLTRQSLP